MKSLAIAALCTLVATTAAAQTPGSEHSARTRTPVSSVQLVVWNRAEQPIDIEVRLGEERVFSGTVRDGNVATSIEVGRIMQREPGSYVLRVIDRTRKHEDFVPLQIDPRGQSVGIHLTPSGLAFVLTRDNVTEFAPQPSRPASRAANQ